MLSVFWCVMCVCSLKATLVVVRCKGRESCLTAEPGLPSRPSCAACHNTLVKFVNVQVNIVASSTGRTRREPRLSGYATLVPHTPHDSESCLY